MFVDLQPFLYLKKHQKQRFLATFYHHFEVIKGDTEVAGLTVRVCDGLACEIAGAQDLLARLPAILGNDDVRVIAAPCIGRCEQAPAVAVHQRAVPFATLESLKTTVSDAFSSEKRLQTNKHVRDQLLIL